MDQSICETPITGDFLAKHLKDALGPHAILKSCDAKRIALGQGFASNILHVKLDWEQDDHLPQSVVIKVPNVESVSKLMETLMSGTDAAAKVNAMMAQFLTIAHKAECDIYQMFETNSPVVMPKYYVALPVTEQAPGMIILEDLSDKASVAPSWIDGLTLSKTLAAVTEVARLHAWSLTTSVDWRSKFASFLDREEMFKGFIAGMAKGFETTKEKYPDQFGSLDVEKCVQLLSPEKFRELITEHNEFMEDVLIHGDYHMNNIMFEKHADGTVGDKIVAVIDFQAALKGPAAYDVARVLTLCGSYDIRRNHYEEIIRRYYDELKSLAGDKLKATYDQMRHMIDRQFAFSSLMMISSIPTMMHILVKDEKDEERKKEDERKVLEAIKANYDDAIPILGL